MQQTWQSLSNSFQETLLACAVPRWFDAAVLRALLDDADRVAAFLTVADSLPLISPTGDVAGRYVLDRATRDELLDILRNEYPSRYKAFHRRAFDHFRDRFSSAADDEQLVFEDELIYHLDELFFILIDAYELSELAQVLKTAAAMPLSRSQHRHLLAYYQGCLHNEREDYDAAAVIFIRLLREPDLEDRLRGRVLTALGLNYDYRGQFDQALEAHRQSREIYARLGDVLGEGKALKNMGIIYHQLAKYEEALSLFEASCRLFQEAGHLGLQGRALNELGYTAKEMGRWDAALDYYQRALDIWRRLEDHESAARVYNNLGEVYHLLGRWAETQSHYEQALAIALDPRYENKREAADMLLNLGFLFGTRNRFGEARTCYERALQLATEIQSPAVMSQVHYRLGDLWQRSGHPRKAYRAYQQAIEAIEAMRGRVTRQEVKISLLGTRQQPYEAMVLLCCQLGWFRKAFHYVERAKARAFLDLLAQRSPQAVDMDASMSDLAEEPLTLRQVQRSLPQNAVLLEYFTTGVVEWGENIVQNLPPQSKYLKEHLVPPARTLAFVITRNDLTCRTLPVSPNALRPGPADPPSGQRFLDEQKLRRLYDVLLAPVHHHWQEAEVLYLVPHGPLHYVPFQALQHPDGHFLLDDLSLAYAPSATVLLRHCRQMSAEAPDTCLAVGYNEEGATALRHAETEAQAIARLWDGQARIGGASKKAWLYQVHGSYQVLHFSCHGRFSLHDPLASNLILGKGEHLTAAEVLDQFHLNADLVVLSACDSGLSRIAGGDELLGLIRAFISAGTPSLVVTQWKVEETSSRIVMERFHQNLLAGLGKAAALREAQLYLRDLSVEGLRQILARYGEPPAETESQVSRLTTDDATQVFAHPRYWAPFILVGEALHAIGSRPAG